MMTKHNKHKSKKALSLLFAGCMLSATLGSFAACGDSSKKKDADDSEVSASQKDDGRVSNANFEIYDDNDGKNLIITPTGWTGSYGSNSTAATSNSMSGIVNTKNWSTYTESSSLAHATKEEAAQNWENLTVRDKLEFIYNWKKEDSDNKVKDLSFYDEDDLAFNYNVDFEDLPSCENPLTHKGDDADEDTSVLMLHNYLSKDAWGTAQKYTSSSTVTLQPGLSAEISVWVKTSDLTYSNTAGESQAVTNNRGAYVALSNTISGQTLDQIQIKNIVANDWTKYTFYVTASDYADTTFTLVLGLGQGGGNKWEYVSGYAFFDDISCTVKRTENFDFTSANEIITANAPLDKKSVLADVDSTKKTVHVDYRNNAVADTWGTLNFTVAETTETKNGSLFTSGITPSAKDVKGVYKKSGLQALSQSNDLLKGVYDKDFASYPFKDSEDVLLLFSASGMPLTAKAGNPLTVAAQDTDGQYKVISFWLKTSDLSGGFEGAGVKLHVKDSAGNNATHELFSAQNTASVTKIDVDGANGEKQENVFDGWQQYFVVVGNNTDLSQQLTLELTYGPTAIANNTGSKDAFRDGYAAFANLSVFDLSEDEFNAISEGTYTKVVTIGEKSTVFTKFDSAAGVPTNAIENGFANPESYDGVYGGSKYVVWNGTNEGKNEYAYAGLLSSEYLSAYTNVLPSTATHTVADILSGATQPLVIYNQAATAYGYIGQTQTISSNSYATVGIKIKASVGAKANVYLMEKTESGYSHSLSVSTPDYIYWYDADGNICAKDPTESGFNKKRDIAFKRNKQGLFEANLSWSGYNAEEMSGKMFANLKNYEKDDETGNLLLAKDGVSYNYDASVWEHEGNNGIAFYAKDKDTAEYYTTAKKTQRVYDLASLSNVADFARYANNAKSGVLSKEVVGTASEEWVEIFFYMHTGNEQKSYRLEVWSGSRDGAEKSAADSYVAFEQISWTADKTSFNNLKAEKLEAAQEAYRKSLAAGETYTEEGFREAYEDIAYSAFSFFDSAKFLRYDETLDKEGVGNSYDSHDATTYKEGLVYFRYFDDDKNQHSIFADYSFVEAEVTADSDSETDDDHDHDDSETEDSGMNIWLLASSLVLAGVLLLAVVSLLVQKIVRKHRKTHGKVVKLKQPKQKKEKSEKANVEENKDEQDPYND